MLRLIERRDLDVEKWDALVVNSSSHIFSHSSYLDATVKNWCVVTDKDYTCGIAVPYFRFLFSHKAYTPVFVRYLEWLGDDSKESEAWKVIQKQFKRGELNVRGVFEGNDLLVYQQLPSAEGYNESVHARRMLRKFERSEMVIEQLDDHRCLSDIIERELPKKVSEMNKGNLTNLNRLVVSLKSNGRLSAIGVHKKGKWLGGIWIVTFNGVHLYLKGAFSSDAKKQGAMYAVMKRVIESAHRDKCVFDFGGSRVEGVRRFNRQFGGEDVPYRRISWNDAPVWQNAVFTFLQSWRKKRF
jgi:hypothetical protein